MIRRRLVALLPLLLLAAAPPALAGEEPKKAPVDPSVDLQPVAMPIVVDGQLMNYVFVNVRVNLMPGVEVARWRLKEPFFRDLLVRAGHEAPFVLPSDYDKVDATRLCAVLTRGITAITGPGVVRSIVITKQVPMHVVATPHG